MAWLLLHTIRSILVSLIVGAFVYLTCNLFPPDAWFPSTGMFHTAQFWIAVAVAIAAFPFAWREDW